MVIKESDIRMAINEAFDDFAMPTWMGDKRNPQKPYTTKDQWNDEIDLFMIELQRGNFIEFGDRSIGVEWRAGGAKNDPRYIVFEFGDARLRDDHFFMQHSPRLSDDDLKTIRDVMVRIGMVSKEEFDMEYGLNMDYSYYESRIDRVVKNVLNEAMWTRMPGEGEDFPPFKGRKPKTPKARINQIYSLVQKYGLSSKRYKDDHWQATDDYDRLLRSLGYDVDWSVENGGYGDYSEFTGRDMSKTYNIVLTAEDGMQIEGYIKMCAAGSNEDPFDTYDTCMILWNKPKRRYDESKINEVTNCVIRNILNEDFQYANVGDGDQQTKEWAYNEAMKVAQELDEWVISPTSCRDDQWTEGCEQFGAIVKEYDDGTQLTIDCGFNFYARYYESQDDFDDCDFTINAITICADGKNCYCYFELNEDDELFKLLDSKLTYSTDKLEDYDFYSARDEAQDERETYELENYEAMRDEY